MISQVLHRAAGPRQRARDRARADRRRLRCSACRSRNIPNVVPPTVSGDHALSRRQRRRPSSTPSRCRSSSRSTASRACSTCSRPAPSDGTYTLTVTFEIGTDPNMAQVLVQNRVPSALAAAAAGGAGAGRHDPARNRPRSWRFVTLTSPDGRYDSLFLCELRDDQPASTSWRACPASATSPSSAPASTRCGSGSTRRSCRRAVSTPQDVIDAVKQQSQAGRGRAGRHAAGAAGPELPVHGQRARPARRRRRSSRTSSSRPDSQGGRITRLKDVGARRARRADLQPDLQARTASRPPASRSTSSRTPTRWTWPSAVAAQDGGAGAALPARG